MTISFRTAFRIALTAGLWIPSLGRVGRISMEEDEAILCRLWQVDILYEHAKTSQMYDCVDDNNMAYGLDDLPSGMMSSDDMKEAGAMVALRGGRKDDSNAKIIFAPGTGTVSIAQVPTTTTNRQHRSLAVTSGTSHVLVIRVNYRGSVPGLGASELAGRVFGLGKDTVANDMAHQYANCSFGKLKMKPFQGTGVTNGVAEIKINHKVSGNNVKVLQNDVFQAAKKIWKVGDIRHLLFVMPPGLVLNGSSRYLAYAYLGSSISVYNDSFGGQLTALMHELGHNMNLHHSGEGNDEYNDQSGYMGYGVAIVGGPNMCFNPQKYHTLGWLQDRSLALDVEDLPWTGNIAPFVHYDSTAENEFVNLSLGGRMRNALYMHYNSAESFNDGTQEFGNKITLVSAVEQAGALKSTVVDAMSPNKNGQIRFRNFEGTGDDLIVQGCKKVTKDSLVLVQISLHLDDGKQSDACDESIVEPKTCTNAPTSVKFFVDEKKGLKNCTWLARKAAQGPTWTKALCVPNHLAYHYCRETCGNC